MCMMESTYAIANSIAGVSGVVHADAKEIVTVPGTNIQSDETEQFDQILKRQKPQCRSLYEELKARFPESEILYSYGYPIAGEDESGFEEALKMVQQADVVILTLGGKHGTCSIASMGEGIDSADINLPKCQDNFIRKAVQFGKPLIGVHFDGRPISSDAADENLNAILEAWSPSETGAQAVTDILFGEYNPGGKLPVTVAYHAGQLPIYYNHPYGSSWDQSGSIGFANYVNMPHRPRYYFGYGLSYTEFEYSDLNISAAEVSADEIVQISFDVKNNRRSSDVSVTVQGEKNKLTAKSAVYYNGNTTFCYTCSLTEETDSLEIELGKGDYEISDIRAWYASPKEEDTAWWKDAGLQLQKDGDNLKGSFHTEKEGWLITSIPYDENFEIRIDGKETTVQKVNEGFTGAKVTAGQHEIELIYHAPGKKSRSGGDSSGKPFCFCWTDC